MPKKHFRREDGSRGIHHPGPWDGLPGRNHTGVNFQRVSRNLQDN